MRRAVLATIAALAALAPPAGAATGVQVSVNGGPPTLLTSDDLSDPDVVNTPVTIRSGPGDETSTTVIGVSAARLAQLVNVPPAHVHQLVVANPNTRKDITLTHAEVNQGFLNDPRGSPRFATFHADSQRIDVFRPVRDDGDVNAPDVFSTSTDDALRVALTTDNTTVREVIADPTDTTVDPGEPVNFTARVKDDPGDVHFTYDWDFGDGTRRSGQTPSHAFAAGHYRVRVSVVGDDGSAGVSDPVDVQVGSPSQATPGPTPSPAPASPGPAGVGGGTSGPGADGNGTPTGGGQGDPHQATNGTRRPQRRPSQPAPRATAAPTAAATPAPTTAPSATAAAPAVTATPTPSPAAGAPARKGQAPAPPSGGRRASVDGILLASAGAPQGIDELLQQAAAAQPAAAVPTARRGGGGGSVAGWVGGGGLLVLLLAGGAAAELRGLRA